MRLTLDALLALDAIAREGSFAKAAESLHKVPSALTYTMQKLESDLEVALFDRSGKRAVLTAIGHLLLEQGRELLAQAEGLERRIKRLGEGWEPQLRIAVDNIVPLRWLYPLIHEFDALGCGTRLKLSQEILGGCWDALIDRRADLAIGAPGDPPSGAGLASRDWLRIEPFVFAVAPGHPLARAPEPLSQRELARHRVVVVSDSSRRLAARTVNVQPAQETLHVPNLEAKVAAQVAGLGIGFLPAHLAAEHLRSGALLVKQVEEERSAGSLKLAWRSGEEGRALIWFRDRILAAGQGPESLYSA
ncbi:MAG: LysR family transcriptional regulator [Stagnimonas sp.]|nr:LysR family transcriptional regulator [Stagnimonas sp.]